MREQRLFHSQRLVVAQSPLTNPNLMGIKINWTAEPVKEIKIQRRLVGAATEFCRINLEPGCRQKDDAPLALAAQPQKTFVSKSGRLTA
jgi:hypothetical protein